MRRAAVVAALALLLPSGGAFGGACAEARAAGVSRATVVVQGDDAVQTRCVEFEEAEISGLELLRRAGFEVAWEDHGAGNVTVCRIDGVGCDHPAEPCFCACEDTADCTFWGYYTTDGDEWRFSDVGAGARRVRDGDVDAWRWGKQRLDGGLAPALAAGDVRCVTPVAVQTGRSVPRAGSAPAGPLLLLAVIAVLGGWQLAIRRRRRDAA